VTTTEPATGATYRPAYEPPPLPEISAHAELALLLRTLARHGYDDLRAGHVTVSQPDGTLLINPRELCWPEVRASDVVTIDADGVKLVGRYNPSIAYGIHLELRRLRPDVGVIVHNHPRWAVVWGDCLRVPPVYDQTSASIPHELVLIDEYEGNFTGDENAAAAAAAFGDAEWALLANHGVLVTGRSIAQAFLRAYTLEWRSQRAWEVEAIGGGRPLDPDTALAFGRHFEPMAPGWWESALRMELARDSSVLD
jgi:ribulose-5-phosphate 4-epimerase/fuculose-1-phosphate aldolase